MPPVPQPRRGQRELRRRTMRDARSARADRRRRARARRSSGSATPATPPASRAERRARTPSCAPPRRSRFSTARRCPRTWSRGGARCELPAVALVDRNGVYGAPRFYKAAKAAGVEGAGRGGGDSASSERRGARAPSEPVRSVAHATRHSPLGNVARAHAPRREPHRLQESLPSASPPARSGSRRARRASRWEQVAAHAEGLHCPDRRRRGAGRARARVGRARRGARSCSSGSPRSSRAALHVELQRHRLREEEHRNQALVDLARAAAPAARRHQRRALRAREGQGAPRRPDRASATTRTLDARGRAARRAARAALQGRAPRWPALFADLPEALDARRRARRSGSTSRSPTSATASPTTRCRRARRRPRTCASSPGTAPARASGRSRRRRRRRSRRSSR